MDKQFAAQDTPVEEQAVSSLWMKELLEGLTEEERQIVYQLYFLERSERQACAAMNLVLSTFQRRKRALLDKLRKSWRKISKNHFKSASKLPSHYLSK